MKSVVENAWQGSLLAGLNYLGCIVKEYQPDNRRGYFRGGARRYSPQFEQTRESCLQASPAMHFLKAVCVLCVLSLFLLFLFAMPAYAEMVEVEGHATIENGKKDVARGRALNDAFHRAVEQVVGIMVESETLVKNFELINDKVYSKTSGYIEKYKILREWTEGDTYKVKIDATVSTRYIEKDLGSLGMIFKKLGKPRLLLLISEQNIVNEKKSNWWESGDQVNLGVAENTMMQKFMERGFDFVDKQVIIQGIKSDPSLARGLSNNPTNDMALKLASEGEAEVVIIGQAVAKAGQPLGGTSIRSCQASISAKVVNADNGETLASFTTSAVSAHVDQITGGTDALRKASIEMADKLIAQLISKWQRRISGTHNVKLVISGLDYNKLTGFKGFLKEHVPGVVNIYERSYQDGVAKVDIEVKSNAKEIADSLSNKAYHGTMINVTSLTGNVIKIRIRN